jgi:peptide deformylase
MGSRRPARSRGGVGRPAVRPASARCPSRGGTVPCAPLNHVLIHSAGQLIPRGYSACSCGHRFTLAETEKRALGRHLGPSRWEAAEDALTGTRLVSELVDNRWPLTAEASWAKRGVVPVGNPAIHRGTKPVGEITATVAEFGEHLRLVMREANGVGLAANQVGAGVRVLAHALVEVAPDVLLNPVLLSARGRWDYQEGCLSLKVDGTRATVTRPRKVLVRAWTPTGDVVVIAASELLARVLQHELDHLRGIEYVQHLRGAERDRVYDVLERTGIDTSLMPSL